MLILKPEQGAFSLNNCKQDTYNMINYFNRR